MVYHSQNRNPRHGVKKAFDKAALSYDPFACVQQRIAQNLASFIRPDKDPGLFLEIGCGTGFLTKELLERYPSTPYLASDLAPAMVEQCLRKLHGYSNLHGLVMDGDHPSLLDRNQLPQPFSWIVSSLAFQWILNLQKCLENLWARTENLAFSTLLEGTFVEWETLCRHRAVTGALYPLWKENTLHKLCASLTASPFLFHIQDDVQEYGSPLAFIQTLKKIGAHTPNPLVKAHAPLRGMDSGLKELLKSYPPEKPFFVTYKVAYCVLKRHST
jgi:malonyl-CoA O-methyltransferase